MSTRYTIKYSTLLHVHVGLGLIVQDELICIQFLHTHTDDDIFYTPAKTPPKKKKQWMDDLLDDDKDLFGDIKVDEKETVAVVAAGKEKLEEETEAKKPKSGGGLFDDLPLDDGGDAPLSTNDGQASNSVNGYKGECWDSILLSRQGFQS